MIINSAVASLCADKMELNPINIVEKGTVAKVNGCLVLDTGVINICSVVGMNVNRSAKGVGEACLVCFIGSVVDYCTKSKISNGIECIDKGIGCLGESVGDGPSDTVDCSIAIDLEGGRVAFTEIHPVGEIGAWEIVDG